MGPIAAAGLGLSAPRLDAPSCTGLLGWVQWRAPRAPGPAPYPVIEGRGAEAAGRHPGPGKLPEQQGFQLKSPVSLLSLTRRDAGLASGLLLTSPLPSPHVVFGIHICISELHGALGGAQPQQPAGGPRTLAAGPREAAQAKAGRDVRHTPYRWGKGPESHLDHPVCSQVRKRPGVARRPLGFRQVSQKTPPARHAGAAVCSSSATFWLGEFK